MIEPLFASNRGKLTAFEIAVRDWKAKPVPVAHNPTGAAAIAPVRKYVEKP